MVDSKPADVYSQVALGECSADGEVSDAGHDVEAWAFAGVDPAVALAVPVAGSWQLYFDDSVTDDVKRSALDTISGGQ